MTTVKTVLGFLAGAGSLILTASAFEERQILAGVATCSNLTGSLGTQKVAGPISFAFMESKFEYWNARNSDHTPTCVVYPTSAQDVSVAIQAIRSSDSRFAIRTAGHNPNPFFSSVDQGVLIDLRNLDAKSYDPATTLATYGPGHTFLDIYEYFQRFGRTVVGARLGGVGTGLALGGGLSFLSTEYGLAADTFRELEIVLPNGKIVTASATQNPDLFFACKGGGGNAYGVVTKYVVQSVPSGPFYAGNLIYLFSQVDALAQALADFTRYNTDPKASIIGTYNVLGTPDFGLNLDQAAIMFLVYNGEDPGDAFKNFTSIPHIINTLGIKSYVDVIDSPAPFAAQISRGDNTFRVQTHRVHNDDWKQVIAKYRTWVAANKNKYILTSLDWQPVQKSLTDASKAQGGNAMDMPDGPWMWFCYLVTSLPGMPKAEYDALQVSFKALVDSTPRTPGLTLFINDAHKDQLPLQTFSTFKRLQEIKRKYDPDGFFSSKTGGFNFE